MAMGDTLDRARNYLAKMPPAIAGQGGHNTTMDAAVVLVRGFALSKPDALELLQEYNSRCQPPWRRAELEHKIRSAENGPAQGTPPPMGYLLGDDDHEWKRGARRQRQQDPPKPPPLDWRSTARTARSADPASWPPAWREELEERVAIMEIEGGLDPDDARHQAIEAIRARYAGRA